MALQENTKQILKIAGVAIAAVVAYKVIFKKETIKTAVENTITEPVKVVTDTIINIPKKAARFLKGSSEARAYMEELKKKRKPLHAFVCESCKKGHMSKDVLEKLCKKCKSKVEIPSYKKGGKVKETGLALVHKGEVIIPKGTLVNDLPEMSQEELKQVANETTEKIVKLADFMNNEELSEKEVLLIMRRINSGKLKPQDVPHIADGIGYKLSDSQIKKGKDWLMSQWKTPKGEERKNNPFGSREQEILEKMTSIRLKDVYSERGNYYIPLYEVEGNNTSFEYYVSGGEISIVG